jgi:hypothetical protein
VPLVPALLALALSDEPLPHAVQQSASVSATAALQTNASVRGVSLVEETWDADSCRCMRMSPHAPNERPRMAACALLLFPAALANLSMVRTTAHAQATSLRLFPPDNCFSREGE